MVYLSLPPSNSGSCRKSGQESREGSRVEEGGILLDQNSCNLASVFPQRELYVVIWGRFLVIPLTSPISHGTIAWQEAVHPQSPGSSSRGPALPDVPLESPHLAGGPFKIVQGQLPGTVSTPDSQETLSDFANA